MCQIKLWGKEVKQKVSHLGRIFFIRFPKMPFEGVDLRGSAGYLSLW